MTNITLCARVRLIWIAGARSSNAPPYRSHAGGSGGHGHRPRRHAAVGMAGHVGVRLPSGGAEPWESVDLYGMVQSPRRNDGNVELVAMTPALNLVSWRKNVTVGALTFDTVLATVDQRVFVKAHAQPNLFDYQPYLVVFQADTGAEEYRLPIAAVSEVFVRDVPPSSFLLLNGSSLVMLRSTGQVLWQRQGSSFAVAASAAPVRRWLPNPSLVLFASDEDGGALLAVDALTGEHIWNRTGLGTPMVQLQVTAFANGEVINLRGTAPCIATTGSSTRRTAR